MLVVQPRRRAARDKKLATVRVLPVVGHGQHARLVMLDRERLVAEPRPVDALAAAAVALHKVAALDHEALDHAVERRALGNMKRKKRKNKIKNIKKQEVSPQW